MEETRGSHHAVQYDQSRIDLLTRMADTIWSSFPDAYVILEHFAENSEETVLSNYGTMLWGNMNYEYNEATMGYHDNGKSDFSCPGNPLPRSFESILAILGSTNPCIL